jgi:hypothetical protein
MFITLTNVAEKHKGEPIVLNVNSIVSINRSSRVGEDKTVEDLTYVFMPPHGTWEVKETPEEILKLINEK